ncbi:MAG: diaminopimelate epimerase [Desulfobacterales bacterium]|jgi:diaminopimelate epimerase
MNEETAETKKIPFVKMSGSGNDFILIDNRRQIVEDSQLTRFIVNVCRRKLSAGADGLILIEPSTAADFKWRFYNSDASRAEMCGNGARCAARFAFVNGIAGPELTFETDVGIISASIVADRAKVRMTDPSEVRSNLVLDLVAGSRQMAAVNTGVPHVVLEVPDLETTDVCGIGREIRYHRTFAPAGTNVNFMTPLADDTIAVRTYERGVEDETLACGTGSIAAALVAAARHGTGSPIRVKTRGGTLLTIHFERRDGRFQDVYLEGDARIIYSGEMWSEAWE